MFEHIVKITNVSRASDVRALNNISL